MPFFKFYVTILLNIFMLGCLAASSVVFAQQTGHVKYEYLGIEFDIPKGWLGSESGNAYLIGSHSKPGLIMLSTHDYQSVAQLREQAGLGLQDEGVVLQSNGQVESLSSQAIGVAMSGIVNGQMAKAYVAGIINPQGGAGVLVLGVSDQANYSNMHKRLVKQVVSSIKFTQAKRSQYASQVSQLFKGAKLTRINSNYSSGFNDYTGIDSKHEINLCQNGHFSSSFSSSVNLGSNGNSAYSTNQGGNQGQWKVSQDGKGNPVLELYFSNGEARYFDVQINNG